MREATKFILVVIAVFISSLGVAGLVVSSNSLSIYNQCSVSPNNSYFCAIYSNPNAMSNYNLDLILQTISGIALLVGVVSCIGAFLSPTTNPRK